MGWIEVLAVSGLIFVIGIWGLMVNLNNLIRSLMCIELILLAASINFVVSANRYGQIEGQINTLFVLVLAACETAVMLSLLVLAYRRFGSIDSNDFNRLKG